MIEKYSKFLESDSKVVSANYYQLVEKAGNMYVKKIFNPDKLILTHKLFYSDENCRTLNGRYVEWYDN